MVVVGLGIVVFVFMIGADDDSWLDIFDAIFGDVGSITYFFLKLISYGWIFC